MSCATNRYFLLQDSDLVSENVVRVAGNFPEGFIRAVTRILQYDANLRVTLFLYYYQARTHSFDYARQNDLQSIKY